MRLDPIVGFLVLVIRFNKPVGFVACHIQGRLIRLHSQAIDAVVDKRGDHRADILVPLIDQAFHLSERGLKVADLNAGIQKFVFLFRQNGVDKNGGAGQLPE